VGVGAVGLDEAEVAFDHFEGGVAEEALEGPGVAVVAEVGDGEGVAEPVGVDVGDAGAVADAFEGEAEVVGPEGAGSVVGADDEQWIGVAGGVVLDAGGEVAPEVAGGGFAEVADSLFVVTTAALAADVDGVGGEVEVGDGEAAEFGAADAGVEEEEENGLVAVGGGAAVANGGAVVPGAGPGGGFEKGLDLVFGEGFDGGGFEFGRVDVAEVVGLDVALVEGPLPEGAAGDVDVVFGFGGEFAGWAGGDAAGRVGDVFVLEPGEELDELVAGDVGDGGLGVEVCEEFAVGVAVVGDGVFGAAGGGFVEDAAVGGAG